MKMVLKEAESKGIIAWVCLRAATGDKSSGRCEFKVLEGVQWFLGRFYILMRFFEK